MVTKLEQVRVVQLTCTSCKIILVKLSYKGTCSRLPKAATSSVINTFAKTLFFEIAEGMPIRLRRHLYPAPKNHLNCVLPFFLPKINNKWLYLVRWARDSAVYTIFQGAGRKQHALFKEIHKPQANRLGC